MKKYILLSFLFISCSVFALNRIDISGYYTCKGSDPFSKENYTAKLTVTKTNETFQFAWDLGRDGKFKGTGFYPLGVKNFIPVTVVSLDKKPIAENPDASELQVYKVKQNGILKGRWTFLGRTKVSSIETCIKTNSP